MADTLESKLLRAPLESRHANLKILENLKQDYDNYILKNPINISPKNKNLYYATQLKNYIWSSKETIDGDGEFLGDYSQQTLLNTSIDLMYKNFLKADCVGLSQIGYVLLNHKGLDTSLMRGDKIINGKKEGHVFLDLGTPKSPFAVDLTNRNCIGVSPVGNFERFNINFLYSTVLSNIGRNLGKQEKYKESLELLNEAINVEPTFYKAYFNRGNIFAFNNDFLSSIKDFQKSIELNPNFEFAYQNLGISKLNYGMNSKNKLYIKGARNDAEKAITLNPSLTLAHETKTLANLGLNQFKDAVISASKGLFIDPKNTSLYLTRGQANFLLKRYKRAIKDFDKAEFLGDDLNLFYYRGLTNLKLKNYKAAKNDFDQFTNLYLDDEINTRKAYFFRGIANSHLGNSESRNNDIKIYLKKRINSIRKVLPGIKKKKKVQIDSPQINSIDPDFDYIYDQF